MTAGVGFQGMPFIEKVGYALEAEEPPEENHAPSPAQTRTEGKDCGVPFAPLSPEHSQAPHPQPLLPSVEPTLEPQDPFTHSFAPLRGAEAVSVHSPLTGLPFSTTDSEQCNSKLWSPNGTASENRFLPCGKQQNK